MDISEIRKVLPHRYPFLLIDRVVEMEGCERIVAIKNVTINEPFFDGHFPGNPVMPGVLLIEAMAQTGAVLLLRNRSDIGDTLMVLAGVDNARFRRTVVPGDQVRFTVECLKLRSRTCKLHGVARVDGELVAEADLLSALMEVDES